MAILKIRDAAGNVQEILVIKGEKGDKGDPGEFTGGELLNAHINNKGNPHEVTAAEVGARPATWMPTVADVGAAPTGYGLGEAAPNKLSLNFDAGNGFFEGSGKTDNSAPYVTSWAGQNMTFGDNFEHGYQEMVDVFTHHNVKARRHKTSGAFGEWEYENPPMLLGVEYRTTERYMGKAVYVKLFDCGTATNGKSVAHGLDNCNIVRYNAGNCPFFFDGEVGTSGQWNIWVAVSASAIAIYCGTSSVGEQVYCQIYYTKD